MRRFIFAAIFVLTLFVLPSSPAGEKSLWQPFLPDAAFKALQLRSAQTEKDEDKLRAETERVIVTGYRLSTEGKLDKEEAAQAEAHVRMRMQKKEVFAAMMEIFRTKAKGGEGIHEDLQYQPKLKNQNGIEALIGALAAKKLSEENLGKVEKELPLLAYRIAVTANLTQYAAPRKAAEEWHKQAARMRDAAIAMAEAAKKKNAEGIQKAADALQNTCTACHRDHKSKS